MDNYSSRITELRKKANLTQSELGEKLNVTPQAVSKWENGLSEPDVETFKKMCELFNVSLEYLINGKEDAPIFSEPENSDEPIYEPLEFDDEPKKPLIIVGYCNKCKAPVGPNGYDIKYEGNIQKIYCHNCIKEINARQLREEKRNATKNTKNGFIWGGITMGIVAIIGLVLYFVLNRIGIIDLFKPWVYWVSYGVAVYGISALVSLLIWDTWISDVFDFFIRSFRMPGLIFSLDLNGIIWFITVKLGLAILSSILSVAWFSVGVVICAGLSIFAFPFSLIKKIKNF